MNRLQTHWQRMRLLWSGSLTARILLLFFGFVALLAALQFYLAYLSWYKLLLHHQQQEHWLFAEQVAAAVQPELEDYANYQVLSDAIAVANTPKIKATFYVVDAKDGTIETAFLDIPPALQSFPLEPIKEFLSFHDHRNSRIFTLPDPSPLNKATPRVFSAAPLKITGVDAYLVAILHSDEVEASRSLLAQGYVLRNSIVALLLGLLCMSSVGIILFQQITKPYRQLVASVKRFREGDFNARFPSDAKHDVGILGVTFNEMADELALHIEQLKKTDSLRRELIAAVSHDLRTPLTSIRGFLDLLCRKNTSLSTDERGAYLENSLHGIDALTRLIDDLFELSRLEAKQKTPELIECFLTELVDDTTASLQSLAASREVTLAVEGDECTPVVQADAGMIERVLQNLIGNALRHTPAGGSIIVRVSQRDGTAMVSVTDSGEGIPEHALSRIFDRFYRVDDSRSTDSGGAGLGLAIVQNIIDMHGGTIEVESSLGTGTTFRFYLPIAQEQADFFEERDPGAQTI